MLKVISVILIFSSFGCASMITDKPSSQAFDFDVYESSGNINLPFPEIDKELLRYTHARKSGINAVIVPLTGALINKMYLTEANKAGISKQKKRKSLKILRKKYFTSKSCFDVFIKGGIGKDNSNIDYYSTSFGNFRKKGHKGNLKSDNYIGPLNSLIRKYIPTSVSSGEIRNITGYGSYSRKIVCGKRINFTKSFYFTLEPRFESSVKKVKYSWLLDN